MLDLGSYLSKSTNIDFEIQDRIRCACFSYGRLKDRVFSERGFRTATKILVYKLLFSQPSYMAVRHGSPTVATLKCSNSSNSAYSELSSVSTGNIGYPTLSSWNFLFSADHVWSSATIAWLTSCFQRLRSSAARTHCDVVNCVHCLMLSMYCFRWLPRLRLPSTYPSTTVFVIWQPWSWNRQTQLALRPTLSGHSWAGPDMSDACQIPEYWNSYCTPSFHQGSLKLADSGNATKTSWKPTWRSVRWTSNGKPEQMTELTGDVHRVWELQTLSGDGSPRMQIREREPVIWQRHCRQCSMHVQCVWSNMSISNRPLQPPTHSSNINIFILIIIRPCDEKGTARAFVDNRKDRRKKKQRSSKNKNTRRYSSLAGKKHCGNVCGCKISQKVEGHDRLRLQQTRQLMMMISLAFGRLRSSYSFARDCKRERERDREREIEREGER